MSHRATNWAIQQRGLKPAAKLLLWHLADRHNADTGQCDPSQELLAYDCEMDCATINRHLAHLEDRGLIRRIQRIDPKTGKQKRTLYQLAFDEPFTVSQNETRDSQQNKADAVSQNATRSVSQKRGEPCRKNGETRVAICDTNPVREPGKEPTRAPARRWAGADADIRSAFKEFWEVHPRPDRRDRTRQLFLTAVDEGEEPERLIAAARSYAARSVRTDRQYIARSDLWLEDARWQDEPVGAGKSRDEVIQESLERCARWITGREIERARRIARSQIQLLLERGMVTAEECRAVGLSA